MFRSLYFALFTSFIATARIHAADGGIPEFEHTYFKAVDAARAEYRQSFAASLTKVTRAEIYLLDFEVQHHDPGDIQWQIHPPKDHFPIVTGKTSRILTTKALSAEEIKRLLPSLQAAIGVKDNVGGAMCHFPSHGLRLWAGDSLLLETNFCWTCHNFYFPYPDFTSGVIGVWNKELEGLMKEMMPIPEED